jgi:hypothetical protein
MRVGLFMVIIGFFLFSCGEEDDNIGSEADLVGGWSASSFAYITTINGEDMVQWYRDNLSLSEQQAELLFSLYNRDLQVNFEGELSFADDRTYISSLSKLGTSGEWSKASSSLKFTGPVEVESTIVELDGSSLVLDFIESEQVDLNEDGESEEIRATIRVRFSPM